MSPRINLYHPKQLKASQSVAQIDEESEANDMEVSTSSSIGLWTSSHPFPLPMLHHFTSFRPVMCVAGTRRSLPTNPNSNTSTKFYYTEPNPLTPFPRLVPFTVYIDSLHPNHIVRGGYVNLHNILQLHFTTTLHLHFTILSRRAEKNSVPHYPSQ